MITIPVKTIIEEITNALNKSEFKVGELLYFKSVNGNIYRGRFVLQNDVLIQVRLETDICYKNGFSFKVGANLYFKKENVSRFRENLL
jgi:hypothetical protein